MTKPSTSSPSPEPSRRFLGFLAATLVAASVLACPAANADSASRSSNGSSMPANATAVTTQYTVSPADIANLMAGEGGVDLRPVMKDGKQVAMEIVGVQPGTTAARLGAQNGDTIESLNDVPLVSIAAAYAAGDRATKAGRIVVRGERHGQPYETVLVIHA